MVVMKNDQPFTISNNFGAQLAVASREMIWFPDFAVPGEVIFN